MTPRPTTRLAAASLVLAGWLALLPGCNEEPERASVVTRVASSATVAAGTVPALRKRRVQLDLPSTPLRAATDAERGRFKEGDALFEAIVRESDGLGPLYIRDSCGACHASDARGPGLVVKAVLADAAKTRSAELLPFGPTERPYAVAGATQALLTVKHEAVTTTLRQPPAVFGRGYLEAVAETELLRLEAEAARRSGSIRGRLHRLKNGKIGRFGIKARLATLRDLTVDALNSDMGITTLDLPAEPPGPERLQDDQKPGVDFSAERVDLITDYVRLLEIPERKPHSERGRELFTKAACATCHVPTLRTQEGFLPSALAGIDAPVYTDLLLHDMGQQLSDGQIEEDAGASEFRTPPLMGLRFMPTLLHDGRARTVEEAILAHGGPDSEGRDSVALFQTLPDTDRRELLRFVESL